MRNNIWHCKKKHLFLFVFLVSATSVELNYNYTDMHRNTVIDYIGYEKTKTTNILQNSCVSSM